MLKVYIFLRRILSHKTSENFLRIRLNDDSLNDNVICYVEKEEMKKITNDQVVKYFMVLKNRMY